MPICYVIRRLLFFHFFQEPVIRPSWTTFSSSVNGIWKGVGAVFSPITAEMEPIAVGKRNEHLFDCYTLSRIETVPSSSGGQKSQIQRRVNWVTLNPYGESHQLRGSKNSSTEKSVHRDVALSAKNASDGTMGVHALPKYESFDFDASDVMEEDVMSMEPGLVFFEVGGFKSNIIEHPVV